MIYGLILPICLILLFNLITFSRVMYRLCRTNLGGNVTSQSKAHVISKRLQNAFVVSILMGLTWVFGFFAIEDAKFAFSLIFCLCNSFQGVVIFLLFCVRQDDVRKIMFPFCVKESGRYDVQSATTSRPNDPKRSTTMLSRLHSESHIYDDTADFDKVIRAKDCAVTNATYDSFIPESEYHELGEVGTMGVYGHDENELVHGHDEDDGGYLTPASPLIKKLTGTDSSKPRTPSTSSNSSQKKSSSVLSKKKTTSTSSQNDYEAPASPLIKKLSGDESFKPRSPSTSSRSSQKDPSSMYAVSAKKQPVSTSALNDHDDIPPSSPLIEKTSDESEYDDPKIFINSSKSSLDKSSSGSSKKKLASTSSQNDYEELPR